MAADGAQHFDSPDPETAQREVWTEWCAWKASAPNLLFREQGTSGQPGRITAATVAHGGKQDEETTRPRVGNV